MPAALGLGPPSVASDAQPAASYRGRAIRLAARRLAIPRTRSRDSSFARARRPSRAKLTRGRSPRRTPPRPLKRPSRKSRRAGPRPQTRRPAGSRRKNYVSLAQVLRELRNGRKVVLEKRPARFMFGTRNYGDVPGLDNRADGDPWDVFAPGYDRALPTGRRYRCLGVLGVYKLHNGNHKIAVRIGEPGFDGAEAQREIDAYCRQYTRKTGVPGKWRAALRTPRSARASARAPRAPRAPRATRRVQ